MCGKLSPLEKNNTYWNHRIRMAGHRYLPLVGATPRGRPSSWTSCWSGRRNPCLRLTHSLQVQPQHVWSGRGRRQIRSLQLEYWQQPQDPWGRRQRGRHLIRSEQSQVWTTVNFWSCLQSRDRLVCSLFQMQTLATGSVSTKLSMLIAHQLTCASVLPSN